MTTKGDVVRLTEWTSCGGCAAKWAPGRLDVLLATLASSAPELAGDEKLLIGLDGFDDAAVLRLTERLALVATTDFFPPMVDDPADYGAIAAANACSDIFAMGGRVVLALNIAAFPERLPPDTVDAIVSAAAAVVAEAGGVVAGGHTIRSEEPIFGLAVQGLVDPAAVLTKRGARPGQTVVLSKPLGTGIVLQGGTDEAKRQAVAGMRSLNRHAADVLRDQGARVGAVTDVTGFGLLGHSWEVAARSGASLVLEAAAMPLYAGAFEAASAGVRTGGDHRNREHLEGRVDTSATPVLEALAFDPQTSGGLLATVDAAALDDVVAEGFAALGEVAEGPPGVVLR